MQLERRLFPVNIPIDYQTAVMTRIEHEPDHLMNGGEDYELLFTVPIADHETRPSCPLIGTPPNPTRLRIDYP